MQEKTLENRKIQEQLERLEKSLDEVTDTVQTLEMRLEPVLAPEFDDSRSVAEEDDVMSPFAKRLLSDRSRLQAINLQLGDIIQRLEV